MNDTRRPAQSLDDLLDASLARAVRRAPPRDLRARVMTRVAQERPGLARPLAAWTAVAAAAIATAVIAAHATRRPVAPSAGTASQAPAAAAALALPSPEPAPASGTARPAASIPSRAHGPHLAPRELQAEPDEPPPLHIDSLEHQASSIVPLHTDDLVIAPLAIEDAGTLSSEDRP